ncbi:MAG TPA: acyl-CoA dehydrogenase family protein [Candidatus Acidoferrales bacterium]|nr:acyl-CoA dehydrogenase family protein [Candidatus Acidoferrales bacterium]
MRLAPTDEQQEIKDAARRICAEQVTAERLAAWAKSTTGVDDVLWTMVADLGWFGLGIPVASGGSGLGLVEVACLVEECGRGLIPRPIINAIRASTALAMLEPQAPELVSLATGKQTLALACVEEHNRLVQCGKTSVVLGVSAEVVDGEKSFVSDAARATWHLVAARTADGLILALVEAQRASMIPLRTFDGDRQARVRYDHAPVLRRVGSARHIERLQAQQTALGLAEMIGGMDGVLAATVEYVKQREQFGQKLAVFQAVQHQIADMAMMFTGARHLAWQAITRLANESQSETDLAMAAAYVGQAFKRLTLAAHHLHGGAGYVIEHPLHFHAERAQALCIRDAPEAPALETVASALLDG